MFGVILAFISILLIMWISYRIVDRGSPVIDYGLGPQKRIDMGSIAIIAIIIIVIVFGFAIALN